MPLPAPIGPSVTAIGARARARVSRKKTEGELHSKQTRTQILQHTIIAACTGCCDWSEKERLSPCGVRVAGRDTSGRVLEILDLSFTSARIKTFYISRLRVQKDSIIRDVSTVYEYDMYVDFFEYEGCLKDLNAKYLLLSSYPRTTRKIKISHPGNTGRTTWRLLPFR